ncbi:hypothetical protein CHUAL_014176 [Chamberlinius hualienensis]
MCGEWVDKDYREHLRVSKDVFNLLCCELEEEMKTVDTRFRKCIPVKIKIAASLYYLAEDCAYKTVAQLFGLGKRSVIRYVHLFCISVKSVLLKKYVPTPTQSDIVDLADNFNTKFGMMNVIGCIDCCHIPISCPVSDRNIDRKCFYSVILQGVVDHKGSFWDIDVGWPGSVRDTQEFTTTRLYKKVKHGFLPESDLYLNNQCIPYHLIGDGAYPLLEWIMKPFTGHNLGEKEQNFNHHLSIARITVEHAFCRLRSQWKRLTKRCDCKLENTINMIISCVVLHNMCEKHDGQLAMNLEMEEKYQKQTFTAVKTNSGNVAKSIRKELVEYFWLNK